MGKKDLDIYKIIAFLTLIIGFILGIILGNTFLINTEEEYDVFNTLLMFKTWCISFYLSIFVYGLYSICTRLDTLIIENPNHKNKVVKKKKVANKKKENENEKSEYNW